MKNNILPVRIQDVARAAGVSVSTVSRVLNGRDDVAAETYRRVQQIIDDMGYSSNLAAKSMRSHRTNVIGGPGAFVMVAKNFDSFGEAIINKLIAEVAQVQERRERRTAVK